MINFVKFFLSHFFSRFSARNNAIADYLAANGFKESLEGFKKEAQMVKQDAQQKIICNQYNF